MDKNEIIARVGYFRAKAGLSQKDLSMDIEMNWGYINRLESKKDFLPNMETLLRIIEACGITEEDFFSTTMRITSKTKSYLRKSKNFRPKNAKPY